MSESPNLIDGQPINIDRRWAALEAGMAVKDCPDFDASLFDDGAGPWIVLKGSHYDGPDPG